MFLVLHHVFGVDYNVIKINNNAHIEKIAEDVIHKTLECCGGIGEAKKHYQPFERTIASAESGFPFFAVSNLNEVVHMTKVDFGEYTSFLGCIEEVS